MTYLDSILPQDKNLAAAMPIILYQICPLYVGGGRGLWIPTCADHENIKVLSIHPSVGICINFYIEQCGEEFQIVWRDSVTGPSHITDR